MAIYIDKTFYKNCFFVDFLDKETKALFYKVMNKYMTFTHCYTYLGKFCLKLDDIFYALSIDSPDTLKSELEWLDKKFEYFRNEFFIKQLLTFIKIYDIMYT